MTDISHIFADLEAYAAPERVADTQRFFKSHKGGYSEHDTFICVRVPEIRLVAKKHAQASLDEIEALLENPIHEVRLLAVIIMNNQAIKARRSNDEHHRALFDLYLRRTDCVNNWDIVDSSCRDVVGEYLLKHPEQEDVVRTLAASQDIWERRIAMVSMWAYIRANRLDLPYEIAEKLLADKHDLLHKAVGWMLRTAGDKDADRLREFLTTHIAVIPRTALRYAIEHFEPEERQYFLKLK